MTPDQIALVRRLGRCRLNPGAKGAAMVRYLATQAASYALSPLQADALDAMAARHRAQLAAEAEAEVEAGRRPSAGEWWKSPRRGAPGDDPG